MTSDQVREPATEHAPVDEARKHKGLVKSHAHCTTSEGELQQDSGDLINFDMDLYVDMPILPPPFYELSICPVATTEVFPLSAMLPMLEVAIWCVWAAHTIPENPGTHKSPTTLPHLPPPITSALPSSAPLPLLPASGSALVTSVLCRSGFTAAFRIPTSAICSALALWILPVTLAHWLSISGSSSTCSTVHAPHRDVTDWTRSNFLQYGCFLTLDPNTANTQLSLSEENRKVTRVRENQSYPDHPDRFDEYNPQVLCRESVCGRCYWEIEWSGGVYISVSYKSISRKRGDECNCVFGSNDQSWCLICTPFRYSFRHNNIETVLPVESISRRIGVFVDHSAGTLSFYSVSRNTMRLIHTVQTTFTQPLYPGFAVYNKSSVKLC